MTNDYKAELEFAKKLAADAGKIMKQYFQVGVKREVKAHEGNTPVTAAEKAISRK